MKKLYLIGLFCFVYTYGFAQNENIDSLAYQLQRNKINQMLQDRRDKFGQYEQSISRHTGIFGWQTKNDIRRSSDILMDIAKTDDDIFKEIKVLLDYRVFRQQQVQTKSAQTENVNLGFMTTINKLRQQTDQLKLEVQQEKEQQAHWLRIFIIVFVLMLGSILFLLLKRRAVKP